MTTLTKQKVKRGFRRPPGDILYPGAVDIYDEPSEFDLRVDRSFTVGCTGHKRNGKTLLLTRMGCIALRLGLPVWANYKISFTVKEYNGTKNHYESQELDWAALYTFESGLEYGVVLIDEIQQWLDNRASGRLNNRMFSYMLRQLGKRRLFLGYSCFSLDTIDKRVVGETDVEIFCQDARKTFWGKTEGTHLQEGEWIFLKCFARSNAWLGFTSWETGIVPEYVFYGKPYWNAYDTGYILDPIEAMTPVELDLAPIRISNRAQEQMDRAEVLRQAVEFCLQQGRTKISAHEFWELAQVEPGYTRIYGQILRKLGVTKKQVTGGSYVYDLSGYAGREK